MSIQQETRALATQFVSDKQDFLGPGGPGHSLLTGLSRAIRTNEARSSFPELQLNDRSLVAWASLALRQELLTAPAGTRFTYLNGNSQFALEGIANSDPIYAQMMARETIAVFHPEKQHGRIIPRVRSEQPKNSAGWGVVVLDQEYTEKALAVGILAETYHAQRGIEAEAILTVVLGQDDIATDEDSLNGLPCRVTHDGRPDYGSTRSLIARASVAGAILQEFSLTDENMPVRLIRYARDIPGNISH